MTDRFEWTQEPSCHEGEFSSHLQVQFVCFVQLHYFTLRTEYIYQCKGLPHIYSSVCDFDYPVSLRRIPLIDRSRSQACGLCLSLSTDSAFIFVSCRSIVLNSIPVESLGLAQGLNYSSAKASRHLSNTPSSHLIGSAKVWYGLFYLIVQNWQ